MQINESIDIASLFSQIIDSVTSSLTWKNTDGVYLGCNIYAAQKLKLKSKDDIIGKTDYNLFSRAVADKLRENDIKVINQEIEISVEENSTLSDGRKIIQLSHKKPLYNNARQVIGIIEETTDITVQKEKEYLELENNAYQAKIMAQERFKQFIDVVQREIESYRMDILNEKTGTTLKYSEFDKQIKLTRRQTEILYFLSLNKSPKEIAFILSKIQGKTVTAATIAAIINKHLYPKFGVFNISQLIEKANVLNLIPFILNL